MSRNSTVPVIPVPPNFVKQYGAQMIATQINATLYGIGLLMVIQYFARHGRKDPWFVKGTVGLLCLLATLETIFTDHQTYANFVLTFGQYPTLNNIVWSVSGKYLFVYLTSFVAQMFYAWCIWIISRSLSLRYRLLVVPVLVFAALQISGGIAQVQVMATSDLFSKLGARRQLNAVGTAIQGAGSAACDIFITISLFLILRTTTGSASQTNDQSLSSKMVMYAFNRAAATSTCAILYVALFYRNMGTYYFMIPFLASTHLNVLSITSLLMSRETLRQEIDRSINHSEFTRAEAENATMVEKSKYESSIEKESPA